MAIKPSFVTGANAKIVVGGKTFAYASDVSYAVTVDTIPVETMGRYEAVTNEPVNYTVGGELSVVRYTKVASGTSTTNPFKTADGGNGPLKSGIGGFFDPASILASATVDIVVFQKKIAAVSTSGASVPAPATEQVVKIKDCRMNRLSGGLNKRGLLVERMSFVGVLLDANDGDLVSGQSGDTDLSA